jgi:beta-lactamase class D
MKFYPTKGLRNPSSKNGQRIWDYERRSRYPTFQSIKNLPGVLARMGYGNMEIGATVDSFWLTGPLKISAVEQTQFLARLAQDALPFPQDFQKSVREIVLLEQGTNWQLYGKTGWENVPGPGVGWWVGWVQKGGRVYAFALNMDMQTTADASKRVELGKASLKALGIL